MKHLSKVKRCFVNYFNNLDKIEIESQIRIITAKTPAIPFPIIGSTVANVADNIINLTPSYLAISVKIIPPAMTEAI